MRVLPVIGKPKAPPERLEAPPLQEPAGRKP